MREREWRRGEGSECKERGQSRGNGEKGWEGIGQRKWRGWEKERESSV